MDETNQLIITSKNYLEILNAKLTPYRVQHLFDGKILYEFWRIKQTEGQTYKNTPKSRNCDKEVSLIVVDKSRLTFRLHYYPLDKNIQVVKDLPIGKLYEAIDLLHDAGF